MLQNAYLLAKIGADTAENEQHFAEILPSAAGLAFLRVGLALAFLRAGLALVVAALAFVVPTEQTLVCFTCNVSCM